MIYKSNYRRLLFPLIANFLLMELYFFITCFQNIFFDMEICWDAYMIATISYGFFLVINQMDANKIR